MDIILNQSILNVRRRPGMSEEVTVGDLTSDARGSGARKNGNKPQWHQLPLQAISKFMVGYFPITTPSINLVLDDLGLWQRGNDGALTMAMASTLDLLAIEQGIARLKGHIPLRALASTVAVLEFGAKKYAIGNWAKGMPWSVCFSCALSHAFSYANGEKVDKESGLSHLAHLMCNLLFLSTYADTYPEGDDRIKQFRFSHPKSADTEEMYDKYTSATPWDRGVEPRGADCITGDFS